MYETISLSVDAGVATLTLNRPEKMNALNTEMRAEITQALTDLDDAVRCVVLTGAGGAFCSGQDLRDFRSGVDMEATLRDEYEPMLNAILSCKAPVIAAVNGPAAGAGANLALAADVIIASESAYFSQAFSKIGLIPDAGGTWILPRLVGNARAMGMMLFAENVPAWQAEEMGMIWRAVPDEQFQEVVTSHAQKLAQGPTSAYLSIRDAVRASGENGFDAQLAVEAGLQGKQGKSSDFIEGVMSFLEKRAPRFTGK